MLVQKQLNLKFGVKPKKKRKPDENKKPKWKLILKRELKR